MTKFYPIHIVPELSEDVTMQPFSGGGFLVHQKKYGYYIKVSKQVYQLLELIDGKRDFKTIAQAYNARYDEEVTPEFSYDLFFGRLKKYGLLSNGPQHARRIGRPDYLTLGFTIINRDSLAGITPLFAPLFHRNLFKTLFVACLLICSWTMVVNWEQITNFLYMFVPTTESLFALFAVTFGSVTLHEFGHASAARYFGAEHGGIGGGFYLFTPVYYADVTDIWRLPKKQRNVVNLAGVYFELLFCSLLCLFGLFWAGAELTVTAFVVFVHSLYNLIPFIRTDGYWVLSDTLNIPNLSKNAEGQLGKWIGSLFGKNTFHNTSTNLFLVLYGSMNFVFILGFVASVLIYDADSVLYFPVNLYNYGSENYQLGFGQILTGLKQFLVPTVFYALAIRWLWIALKKGRTRFASWR